MFYTDFVCTMNFLHHRGGGVNCILTAPIKVPWCELLGLFLKKNNTSVCASSYVSSENLGESRQSHTGCICLAFLHCVFSDVDSTTLPEKMQSHIGCICLFFLHCVLSNVPSKRLPKRRHSHIDCICLTFLHCAF